MQRLEIHERGRNRLPVQGGTTHCPPLCLTVQPHQVSEGSSTGLVTTSYPDPVTGVELALPHRQAVGLAQSLALASAPPLSCGLSDLLLLFSFCALKSMSSYHFSESTM